MSDTNQKDSGGHGGDLLAAMKRWQPVTGKLIDFSSNINPLGTPPGLIEHLAAALPEIVAYPTPRARELREKLALYFSIPAEKLVIGNGANDLIHQLVNWISPRRVFVPAPSFSEYERAARFLGASLSYYYLPPVETIDFEKTAAQLEQGDLIIFCNPNNPTGLLSTRAELITLVEKAAGRGAVVMFDESFIPLTGKPEESLRDFAADNLWVITSLTKIWGLPGLRLGCAIGPTDLVRKFTRWEDPWKVNSLAQLAGIYCSDANDYLKDTEVLVKNERAYLFKELQKNGHFKVLEGSANFLLLRCDSTGFQVAQFQEELARQGILIRRADNFRGLDHRFLRIAVKKRADNLKLLQETNKWFAGRQVAGETGKGGVD